MERLESIGCLDSIGGLDSIGDLDSIGGLESIGDLDSIGGLDSHPPPTDINAEHWDICPVDQDACSEQGGKLVHGHPEVPGNARYLC